MLIPHSAFVRFENDNLAEGCNSCTSSVPFIAFTLGDRVQKHLNHLVGPPRAGKVTVVAKHRNDAY